jgi:hypothetical protein
MQLQMLGDQGFYQIVDNPNGRPVKPKTGLTGIGALRLDFTFLV